MKDAFYLMERRDFMKSKNGNTDGFRLDNLIEAFERADKDLLKENFPQIYYALLDVKDGIKSGLIEEIY